MLTRELKRQLCRCIENEAMIIQLENRINNLEIALHGLWVYLRDRQDPITAEIIDKLMADHFSSSSSVGGFKQTSFYDNESVSHNKSADNINPESTLVQKESDTDSW